MPFRTFKYYFGQAVEGIGRNGLMSFISATTVAFCLMLLGISILFGNNLQFISSQLQSQFEIQVYMDDTMSADKAKSVEGSIESISGVKKAQFISKEDALKDFQTAMGDDNALFEGLDEKNPLRHSYRITLTDISIVPAVTQALEKIAGVAKVVSRTDILEKLLSFTTIARNVGFGAMLIFAIIAIFIISNTIKLAVMARRKEINIMKLVGATDWFIRWPFVIEGALVGILGAVAAYVPVILGYTALYKWWTNFWSILKLIPASDVNGSILVVFVVTGIVIGGIGSMLALRKYLDV